MDVRLDEYDSLLTRRQFYSSSPVTAGELFTGISLCGDADGPDNIEFVAARFTLPQETEVHVSFAGPVEAEAADILWDDATAADAVRVAINKLFRS